MSFRFRNEERNAEPMAVDLKELNQAIIAGNRNRSVELTKQAITEEAAPAEIITAGLISGMTEVGRRFKANEYFVPDMLVAARAMHASLEELKPVMLRSKVAPVGRIVAGTVKGDLHDVGKNLVCMMLEGAGFDVVDLGVDVSPEKFVNAVREGKADILAMSALLTTTMPSMKTTIDALAQAGLRKQVKVLVGGSSVTQYYADNIGADGYAPDAASAADVAKNLVT
jgi:5-methyltetrahydrofolate--homocysteine methyltransferase